MISSPDLKLLVGTRNEGKIREIQAALSLLPIRLIYLNDFPGVSSVAEVGQTYEQNAVLKALGYSKQTGFCALADDSGLGVDALGGRPGVFSARFGGSGVSDVERNQQLLAALSNHQVEKRSARFVCVMALAGWRAGEAQAETTDPRLLKITEASCEGVIATTPRGNGGFGFDPIFMPKGYRATFGELPAEVKARISHRALALDQMREFLERWLTQT